VHTTFVAERRSRNLSGISDSELYAAFDLTYDYDICSIWQAAVVGKVPVARYLEMLRLQDGIYPASFVKMRFVENHDQPRIMGLARSRSEALAWTAFQAFNRGAFLIYGGQESAAAHTPSLFDVDKVAWGQYELQPFLTRLAQLKKDPAQISGQLVLLNAEPAIQAAWRIAWPGASLYGVFNTSAATGQVDVPLPDGAYVDLLSGTSVSVERGRTAMPDSAFIVRYSSKIELKPFYSDLLDHTVKAK